MVTDSFDYKKARAFLAEKEREYTASCATLFEQARSDCNAIIEMIITDFSPKRVWQWGSLLSSHQFDENSDIDIAVEGLVSVQQFFEMYEKASSMTNFPLDLIEIEKIEKLHRKSIEENGVMRYEKK